jgi:hypothetical protein
MWIARSTRRVRATAADIAAADGMLRWLDVNLRTPDALHIAIAGRLDATLVTFHRIVATAARVLGMAVDAPRTTAYDTSIVYADDGRVEAGVEQRRGTRAPPI